MDINKSKVFKAPGLGNGLVVSRDVDAGEAIIQISNPYIAIVEKAALATACSYCLYESSSLKRCSKCKVAHYCSPACQTLAWKAEHRKECSVLKNLPDVPPTAMRALIQVLQRHAFGVGLDPRWASLETNQGELRRSNRWEEVVLQARAGIVFSKSPTSWSDIAIGVLCRMTANAFRISLADNTVVGLCFEPILALANHSCTPNASVVFDGRTVTLRALDPIKKYKQIFISYIDFTSRRDIRQAELKDHYFFACHCEKCEKDESPYSSWQRQTRGHPNPKLDILITPSTLQSLAKAAINHPIPSKSDSERILSETSDRQILKRALLTPAYPPYPEVLHQLYLHHLNASSYGPALIILIFIHLNCDVFLYPQPHHTMRVVRLLTVAKLCLQMVSPETPPPPVTLGTECREILGSIDWISAAQAVLILVKDLSTLSHGVESRFYREVQAELADVEEVQRSRGTVGEALRAWGERGDEMEEGRRYAEKVFEGLRIVGGKECAEALINQAVV